MRLAQFADALGLGRELRADDRLADFGDADRGDQRDVGREFHLMAMFYHKLPPVLNRAMPRGLDAKFGEPYSAAPDLNAVAQKPVA